MIPLILTLETTPGEDVQDQSLWKKYLQAYIHLESKFGLEKTLKIF